MYLLILEKAFFTYFWVTDIFDEGKNKTESETFPGNLAP